jgi:N,N'-diacetyllegionaminate synthase
VYYIAEIGNNHEGSFSAAEDMVHAAAQSGASAVKFQYIVPEKLVTRDQASRIQQLSKFRLSDENYSALSDLAKKLSIDFFATCFDVDSLKFLRQIQNIGKVASSDNNFWDLIEGNIFSFDKIFISTGGMDNKNYRELSSFVSNQGSSSSEVVIFHCVSIYPTTSSDAQLWRLDTIKDYFQGLDLGYSDHTLGNSAARLAVAKGAKYIEKHFTLDKNFSDFRDHKLSATPSEFKALVDGCNEACELIGEVDSPRPEVDMESIRRKATAKSVIRKGETFTKQNIEWLRSDNVEAVDDSRLVYGKIAKREITEADLILRSDLG